MDIDTAIAIATNHYTLTILALLAGTFTHVVKKIVQKREKDVTFTLKRWWTDYPYKTVLTVMAGIAGYITLYATDELTVLTSFMTGFMANSLGGTTDQ